MESSTHRDEIVLQIDTAFLKILTSVHNFHKQGSNWVFYSI